MANNKNVGEGRKRMEEEEKRNGRRREEGKLKTDGRKIMKGEVTIEEEDARKARLKGTLT